MGNPASHQEFQQTCPNCSRPVRTGYKFCDVCGARMPSLSTCSRCGTQTTHPGTFCDLCGAPFIIEEIPEPDMERIPEDGAGTMPEPDAESPPKPHAGIQPEPDTDELLQQYGAEYDDEETLESRHPPKPAPSGKPAGKKPVSVPPEPQRQSVDDALFFPDKDRVAAKPAKTTAAIVRVGIAVMLIAAGMYFIGLPVLKNYQSGTDYIPVSGNTTTPVPTVTIPTATPTRTSHSLVPLPTQTIPSGQVTFYVQKHPVTSKITVIFTGSSGKDGISYAIVTVTHPDGSVTAGSILPLKGVNEVMVDGSKDTDRVEIIAMMSDGKTYRVYDDLVPP